MSYLEQEVWDRWAHNSLARTLKEEAGLEHFLVDIGRQSLANNYCTGCTYAYVSQQVSDTWSTVLFVRRKLSKLPRYLG